MDALLSLLLMAPAPETTAGKPGCFTVRRLADLRQYVAGEGAPRESEEE